MTLQEAILETLSREKKPSPADSIASRINDTGLFIKIDGKRITPKQVKLKAKQFPKWFKTNGDNLISLKVDDQELLKIYFQKFFSIYKASDDNQLNALIYFFYFRLKAGSLKKYDRRDLLEYTFFKSDLKGSLEEEEEKNDLGGVFTHLILNLDDDPLELIDAYAYMQDIDLSEDKFSVFDFNTFFLNTFLEITAKWENKPALPYSTANFIQALLPLSGSIYVPNGDFEVFRGIINNHFDPSDTHIYFHSNDYGYLLNARIFKHLTGFNNIELLEDDLEFISIKDLPKGEAPISIPRIENLFQISTLYRRKDIKDPLGDFEYALSLMFGSATKVQESTIKSAFLIVPEQALIDRSHLGILDYKYLVEFHLLKAVINLPPKLIAPSNGSKLCLLILEKQEEVSSKVRFIDCSHLSEDNYPELIENVKQSLSSTTDAEYCRTVEAPMIQERNYDLRVRTYLPLKRKVPDHLPSAEYTTVKELIQYHRKGSRFSQDVISSAADGIPLIKIHNLNEGMGGLNLDLTSVTEFVPADAIKEKYLVAKNSILVATHGTLLKPTLYSGELPIVISSNILALYPDVNKVLPEFLLMQLRESYLKEQLAHIRNTVSIPYFRIADFLNLQIRIPDLEQQQREVRTYQALLLTEVTEELREREEVYRVKELKVFKAFKHELGNRSGELNNHLKTIHLYLENIGVDLNKKISQSESAPTINELFTRIYSVQSKIADAFKSVQNVFDFQKGSKKEKLSLIPFVQHLCNTYKKEHAGLDYVYLHTGAAEDFVLEADPSQMHVLFENFLKNADLHGFSRSEDEVLVGFGFELRKEDGIIVLHLVNNGRKLPSGFTMEDLTGFGIKGGNTGNTGIGGYLIRIVVENHRGKLRLGTREDWSRFMHFKQLKVTPQLNTDLVPNVYFVIELPI